MSNSFIEAPLVDPLSMGWSTDRRAAAMAVAGPNSKRIADAALTLLAPGDHVEGFTAWCDSGNLVEGGHGGQR